LKLFPRAIFFTVCLHEIPQISPAMSGFWGTAFGLSSMGE